MLFIAYSTSFESQAQTTQVGIHFGGAPQISVAKATNAAPHPLSNQHNLNWGKVTPALSLD